MFGAGEYIVLVEHDTIYRGILAFMTLQVFAAKGLKIVWKEKLPLGQTCQAAL